jgi:hypothetical protein
VSFIYIDPIFQVQFESYSLVLGGKLTLYAPHFRERFRPEHSFSVASKISQDAWIVFQELFSILDNKKGTWRSVSSVAPCQFLSSTWDILVGDKRYPQIASDPMTQFFRYVRNAASHGNRFKIQANLIDITTNKLKENVEWRGTKIIPSLDGSPLFPDFMEMADPIWLVSDISNLLKTAT